MEIVLMNVVHLIGRLGQDPELNAKGTVCNLNLATNGRAKEGDTWKTTTDWHRVVCFGRTAENVQKYCTKGSQIAVTGKLQTRSYEAKDGSTRYVTEVVANSVQFLGSKEREEKADTFVSPF
jgi:single-strand DNA-binding protein